MINIYQGTVPVLPLSLPAGLPGLPHCLSLPAGPGLPADLPGLPLVLGILLSAALAALHLSGCDQGDVPVPDTDLGNILVNTNTIISSSSTSYLLTGCERLLSQSLPHSHNISFCLAISD